MGGVLVVALVLVLGDRPAPAAWRETEISCEASAWTAPPAAVVVAAPTGRPDAPGDVRGRFVDTAGAPVADVAVELREVVGPWQWRTVAATSSDRSGAFRLPVPAVGVGGYALRAAHPSFAMRTILLVETGTGLDVNASDVVLGPGILVEGVIRRADGRGVAGAVVHWDAADPAAVGRAETDATGRFVLGRFPPGMIRATVIAGGVYDDLPRIAVDGTESVVRLEHELDAVRPVELRVRSRSGAPLREVEFRLWHQLDPLRWLPVVPPEGPTGVFRFRLPADRPFAAHVFALGHAPDSAPMNQEFVDLVLEPSPERPSVALEGAETGTGYRLGFGAPRGPPFPLPALGTARTWRDAPLAFAADGAPRPRNAVIHVLAADLRGYGVSKPITAEVLAGGAPIRVALKPTAQVRIRCIEEPTGKPAAGARVRLLREVDWTFPSPRGELAQTVVGPFGPERPFDPEEPIAEVVADTEGWAVLPMLPGVRLRIAAEKEGFGRTVLPASVVTGGEATVRLPPEARLVVSAPEGGAFALIVVRRIDRNSPLVLPAERSAEGAMFRGLAPGRWLVGRREDVLRFGDPTVPTVEAVVAPALLGGVLLLDLEAGDRQVVALEAAGDALVAGEIRAPFDGAVFRVDVVPEALADDMCHRAVQVDGDGRFVLGPFPPGRYVVRMFDDLFVRQLLRAPVELTAGTTCRIRFHPNLARVRVTVTPSDVFRQIAVETTRPGKFSRAVRRTKLFSGPPLILNKGYRSVPAGAKEILFDLPPGEYDLALERVDAPGKITVEAERNGLTIPPGESTIDIR